MYERMGNKVKVLTNNPLVYNNLTAHPACAVDYREVSLHELMLIVRDFVHLGHRLLTHPLSGSVKPNETFYKSIGISVEPEGSLCLMSLDIIEHSIQVVERFARMDKTIQESSREDLQLVDLTLMSSALDSLLSGKSLPLSAEAPKQHSHAPNQLWGSV